MHPRLRRIFLISTVVVPFLAYSVYYYSMVIKNAPYRFVDFDSIVFQYGPGDSLVNKYNSKTGDYQYVDSRDSLVKMKLRLSKDELLYLHHKAAELGLWDFPEKELGDTAKNREGRKPLRYLIEFNYRKKSKKVIFDSSFEGPEKLVDANKQVILEIKKVLDAAEAKQRNNK